MSDSLKKYIETVYRIFDELDGVGLGIASLIPEIKDEESKELLRTESIMFMLYLAASDGDVSQREASFIGEYFGVHMSIDDMRTTIKENNIYSRDFEKRIPLSVQMMVEADNRIVQAGTHDSTGCQMIYGYYKSVGQAFLACDNSVGDKELGDFACYLERVKQYINEKAQTSAKIISNPDIDAQEACNLVMEYEKSPVIPVLFPSGSSLTKKEDLAPWDTVYYNHACPYCGKYKVRPAKWEDKQFSAAFWGFFSYKLHCRFKCDACKSMWN